jgi:phospholipase C
VTVLVSAGATPDADKPSHFLEVHAELVPRLPVPDADGGMHHTMPPLTGSCEYVAYIRERSAAWIATRPPARVLSTSEK